MINLNPKELFLVSERVKISCFHMDKNPANEDICLRMNEGEFTAIAIATMVVIAC